jgi:methyltransferase
MVMVDWAVLGLLAVIIVQRLSELRLAKRNEAWAREQGAVEYGARHYPLFFVLHTGWLLAWPVESWIRGPELWTWWFIAAGGFLAAELLRYWSIRSLGGRWNTRILILPDASLVERGPYRWLRHPNYVAVAIELAAVPAIFGAWWTLAVVSALNALVLLAVRIPAEERALGSGRRSP